MHAAGTVREAIEIAKRKIAVGPNGPNTIAAIAQLPNGKRRGIIPAMKLQEIEREALGLSESERAELVLSLMDTLVAPGTDISDEEVYRRDDEAEAGSTEVLLHEEFVRRVREERGR